MPPQAQVLLQNSKLSFACQLSFNWQCWHRSQSKTLSWVTECDGIISSSWERIINGGAGDRELTGTAEDTGPWYAPLWSSLSEHNRETCAEHQINFKYKAGRQGLNNSHLLRMTGGNQLENTMLSLHFGIGSTIWTQFIKIRTLQQTVIWRNLHRYSVKQHKSLQHLNIEE